MKLLWETKFAVRLLQLSWLTFFTDRTMNSDLEDGYIQLIASCVIDP